MFNKLKGVFFEEGDETPPPTPKTKADLPATPAFLSSTPSVGPSVVAHVTSGRFKDKLVAEVQAKFQGQPYMQFQKIATGMKAAIADVGTRTVATVASLTAQGTGKDKILASANDALLFLSSEGQNFHNEISNDIANLDAAHTEKSQKISMDLEAKQAQIKTLSEEISALQIEKSQAEVKLIEEKTKLQVTKAEFEGCLNSLVQEINSDVSDVTRYGV